MPKIAKIVRKNYLLILIFLIGLAVRLVGTKHGFPPYHPDEPMSYSTARYMLLHSLKPNRFDYPAGVPLLHNLIYRILILPFVFFKLFFPHPRVFFTALRLGNQFLEEFRETIFGYREIEAMFWSRYIAATIGALAVPLVYWAGKKLFNKRVGLFSAFFLAFNFRHVLGSHFGLPDIHNSFFSLLALFASVLLLEKNTKKRYLFAGITCGLTFSIKYQIFSFLPFFLVHLIWAFRKRSWKYLFKTDFIKACFLSFLVFLIINPYFFFHLDEVLKFNRRTALRYQIGVMHLRLYPYFYLYHWGIGHLPSLAIILGLLLMFLIKPLKLFIIFSFVFPFFFVMTYYSAGGDYTRNFITPMPFLCLLAGFFMENFYQLLKKIRLPATIMAAILLFYFNFNSAKNSFILSYYYAQPWNFTELSKWFEEKMVPGVKIRAYPMYMHSTVWTKKNIEMLDWDYSQGPHSLAEFQEEGTDFAILNTRTFEDITYWWRQWPNYMFFKYDQVPFVYINSSFYGLTIQELLNYTVHEIYKPWQAFGEYNFLVFKIPPKPKEIGQRIAFFDFDEGIDYWEVRSPFGLGPLRGKWSRQEGRKGGGALIIDGGSGQDKTSRLSSSPIKIEPRKLYTVRGWIKNVSLDDEVAADYRDGFLRIDFYRGQGKDELEKNGLTLALSSRAFLRGDWEENQVSLVAPDKARYLTISFQRKEQNQGFDSYLDDVEVFESDVLPEEKFKELPYIQPTIPQESIYPNSSL